MAFHFSKRIKSLLGVRVNLGLKGASLSLGGKGATLNIGKRGVHATASIPGTSLSYRERLDRPTEAAHRQEPAPVALSAAEIWTENSSAVSTAVRYGILNGLAIRD